MEAERRRIQMSDESTESRHANEELNLRGLRQLREFTQARLAKKLKIGQEGVSRVEMRSDLYLSTLRSYVEAVGGELTLTVHFPDRQPVVLAGFGEKEDRADKKKDAETDADEERKKKKKKSKKDKKSKHKK
jgi:transcriptional regulator with XRE-family HTH domain